MSTFKLTDDHIREFEANGYIIATGLFDTEEVEILGAVARADEELKAQVRSRKDAEGGITTLSLSNELGDDIYSAIVRCRRMTDTMERLLGDEVYHYHHKMNMKAPYVGGAWEWHQDYGYWYNNGCLFPDMASCLIAIDRASKENGCLQVVKHSHLLGRMDHMKVGDQTGADPERVTAAVERLPLEYCELEPGAAVFFHANTLHRSDQNTSENPRWAFICCYNSKHNDPYKDSKHPRYSPLEIWDDTKILELGHQHWNRMSS